jgi:hypothetical protein
MAVQPHQDSSTNSDHVDITQHSSPGKGEHISEHMEEMEIHAEHIQEIQQNYTYDDEDEEPELHATTWIALGSMCLLILAVLFALQGPPTVVSGDDNCWWRQRQVA